MKHLISKIKELSRTYYSEIIEIRQHLHTIPETGYQEISTSRFIAERLTEMGIPFNSGIAKTGIMATITGSKGNGKVIALRADMDAIEINEQNNIPYISKFSGMMHACGHDAHMASLLGTAKILNELKSELNGTVKFFFQPSEEKFPGGAKPMIDEGVLENPKVSHVLAQHVYPELESGKVGFKTGKYMASTDEIYITVKGKGGHGGTPEKNIDPVLIAAHILVALQQIISRSAPPEIPAVLSFGRFIAEGRTNIIPDFVKMDGTLRTFDEEWRKIAHQKITKMVQSMAESMGGSAEILIDKGYPFVVNDESLTLRLKQWAEEYLGAENVVDLDLRMTAEDFSYFGQKVPSCFYRLGTRNEKMNIVSNLHTSTFDIDEKSIETGMGLMAWFAIMEINRD